MKIFAQVADEHIIGWEVVPCGPDLILSRSTFFKCFVARSERAQKMWWTTDNRVQRPKIRFCGSFPVHQPPSARPTSTARKQRHLKLPVTVAQAAANLMLQESGADCNAEVPVLRKDIQSLENALRDATTQNRKANASIECLENEKQRQLHELGALAAEFQNLQGKHDLLQCRTREERQWLKLAADLANGYGRRTSEQADVYEHAVDLEQQAGDLKSTIEELLSDKRGLVRQLELATQENKIFSDVISDMESRHTVELQQAQEQLQLLQKRISQDGATDRSQIQTLNIKIVSQAAEIRSLEKQLAGGKTGVYCEEVKYEPDSAAEQPCGDPPDAELIDRLENSLQAARIELDAAVHDLRYANAESNRLRDYVRQVEQAYDSEFHHVVQVAELHAIIASKLEQSRESDATSFSAPDEQDRIGQGSCDQEALEDLVTRNAELATALKAAESNCENAALTRDQLELQAQELRDLNHELGALRAGQASLSGENEKLSALNRELEQRLSGLKHQLSEAEQKWSDDNAELERLVIHHEGATNVANAECRLVKSRLDEQRAEFESKLKQQLEVIQCLHADVGAARGLQARLERDLEEEKLNRQLAEQEVRLAEQESARDVASSSDESPQSVQDSQRARRDEPGDYSSARSAA